MLDHDRGLPLVALGCLQKEPEMPLYEYRCRGCGAISEHLVLGGDEETTCGNCGGRDLEKLMSPSADHQAAGDRLPGAGDTTCCGHGPGVAGCAGPGSCCGKA